MTKFYSLLGLAVLSTMGAATTAQAGTARVIGGEDVSDGDWPYMVAVMRLSGGSYQYSCAGVLINKDYVLTSADCVSADQDPDNLQLIIGDTDLSSTDDQEVRNVESVLRHSSYDPDNFKVYNFALLELRQSSDKTPVGLFTGTIGDDSLSSTGKILSWQKNYEVNSSGGAPKTELSDQLWGVDVTAKNADDCSDIWAVQYNGQSGYTFPESMVCASSLLDKDERIGDVWSKGTCDDTGAPLLVKSESGWLLAGIRSQDECGDLASASVFSSIHYGEEWINEYGAEKEDDSSGSSSSSSDSSSGKSGGSGSLSWPLAGLLAAGGLLLRRRKRV